MKNFYDKLKKYFLGQASPQEEKHVKGFRKKNPLEYKMLYFLWWSNISIKVTDFDAKRAWQKILERAEPPERKTIPMYGRFIRVAAAIAIFITLTFSLYHLNEKWFRNEIVVATNMVEKSKAICLPDGSKIWLNQSTHFSYPKKFESDYRKVSLEGEAYFEIAKNPDKPFIVETSHAEIKVLGTSFNINTNKDKTDVEVRTGKVKVKSLHTQQEVKLEPNSMAVVSKNEILKSKVNNPNYLSWKTGRFTFKNTSIDALIKDLNSYYSKKVILKNTHLDCNFTANFNNAELTEILEVLALTCEIQITEKEDSYEIY